MITTVKEISTLSSPKFTLNLSGLELLQYDKYLPGGIVINYVDALSSINDFGVRSFTNFYLTDSYLLSDITKTEFVKYKANTLYGPLKVGNKFLKFESITKTNYRNDIVKPYYRLFYGEEGFVDVEDEYTNFSITIKDNNQVNISYSDNSGRIFYLCVVDNVITFVNDTILYFDETKINPQDFSYILCDSTNSIFLFKKTETGIYGVVKNVNKLELVELSDYDPYSVLSTPLVLPKSIYDEIKNNLNSSFVRYSQSNSIDIDRSMFNLKNNYLLHKTSDRKCEIITLKSQLPQSDVFSSCNNLLSGDTFSAHVDGLREYTNITKEIDQEQHESLELNYVFYNKTYEIKSGDNYFTSPSSIYPFQKLNINDTTFIDCGAFAHTTPLLADKIYHLSKQPQNLNNGQYLLCTWLSGNPITTDKVWVDRYYYPDLIEKEIALSSYPVFQDTYEDEIEKLISANLNLKDEVDKRHYFDKKSDFVFEPNENYKYERITKTSLTQLSSFYSPCVQYTSYYPSNYFLNIIKSGEMTLSFEFDGDDSSWIVESVRNDIDGGIQITKNGDTIYFKAYFYNSITEQYSESVENWFRVETQTKYKKLKKNKVSISFDSKIGHLYIFFNDKIIKEEVYTPYQLFGKNFLFGDFIIKDTSATTIPTYELVTGEFPKIYNYLVSDQYQEPSLILSMAITETINDIQISLPCGMRNSIDELAILQNVCGSAMAKSSKIDIVLKNININNETIINNLKNDIKTNIESLLPTNVSVNNIKLKNYKL